MEMKNRKMENNKFGTGPLLKKTIMAVYGSIYYGDEHIPRLMLSAQVEG